MLVAPLPEQEAQQVELVKGPNISGLPDFDPLANSIAAPVLLKVGDNISTDEISPAGQALPFRSNIPKLAEFTYTQVDQTYPQRAAETASGVGHVIVAGENYGQGSSRASESRRSPRDIWSLRRRPMSLTKSYGAADSTGRTGWRTLSVNNNTVRLGASDEFPKTSADYDRIAQGDRSPCYRARPSLLSALTSDQSRRVTRRSVRFERSRQPGAIGRGRRCELRPSMSVPG